MTAVEVSFNYGMNPTEIVMRALDMVREVYGIRRIRLKETERIICVEYDATRLNEDTVAALLRRSGMDLRDRVALV
jgi:hypothetical protein